MNLHVTNGASDRLPAEMISEYRVFSSNHVDLLTRRFVLHPFPMTFRYQDKGALSDYINDSYASCQQHYPVRQGTWPS